MTIHAEIHLPVKLDLHLFASKTWNVIVKNNDYIKVCLRFPEYKNGITLFIKNKSDKTIILVTVRNEKDLIIVNKRILKRIERIFNDKFDSKLVIKRKVIRLSIPHRIYNYHSLKSRFYTEESKNKSIHITEGISAVIYEKGIIFIYISKEAIYQSDTSIINHVLDQVGLDYHTLSE